MNGFDHGVRGPCGTGRAFIKKLNFLFKIIFFIFFNCLHVLILIINFKKYKNIFFLIKNILINTKYYQQSLNTALFSREINNYTF